MRTTGSRQSRTSRMSGCSRQRNRSVPTVLYSVALSLLTFCSCENGDDDMADPATQTEIATIKVSSPAFQDGGMIPNRYTCGGDNISPPLSWEALPDGTKSLALIVDDPDAPGGTFVHWVVYDLPADLEGLPEDLPRDKAFPIGGNKASTAPTISATWGLAPRAARTGTSSSSTPSMRGQTSRRARPRPGCSMPWKGISSDKASSWAGTRGSRN